MIGTIPLRPTHPVILLHVNWSVSMLAYTTIRKFKSPSMTALNAVILALLDAACFGFFYSHHQAIEVLKQSFFLLFNATKHTTKKYFFSPPPPNYNLLSDSLFPQSKSADLHRDANPPCLTKNRRTSCFYHDVQGVLDSSQSCCSISPYHQDQGSKLRGYWFYNEEVSNPGLDGMGWRNSSQFTLSHHQTVTVFLKRFHSKSTLCSSPRLHCN